MTQLRACFPTQGNWCYSASVTAGAALDVFNGSFVSYGSYGAQFYSGWSTQPNCQTFGINTPYQYQRVRFGFTANQEADCLSNDNAVGLGVGPLNTAGSSWGAGQKCMSTGCSNGNVDTGFPGLLWGR